MRPRKDWPSYILLYGLFVIGAWHSGAGWLEGLYDASVLFVVTAVCWGFFCLLAAAYLFTQHKIAIRRYLRMEVEFERDRERQGYAVVPLGYRDPREVPWREWVDWWR